MVARVGAARGLAMTGEARSVDAKLDEAWCVLDEVSPIPGELGSHYNSSLLTMPTAICYCESLLAYALGG